MNVLLRYGNGQIIEKPYPTSIEIEIPGLNKAKIDGKLQDLPKDSPDYIEIFWINEVYPEIDNINKTRLSGVVKNEYTNEIHKDYKHFRIVNRIHLTEEIPIEQVIENLNQSYGNYLDEQYPQVERLNHSIELQAGTTQDRVDYIKTLQSWLIDCKLDRKKRIQDYIENGIFPSFENFIIKP